MTKHVFYHGDVIDCLRKIPEKSVNTVITSPPYWGLRDYGVDGQLGLESTPDEYVTKMVDVFREVRRVLRDDGTLWLNLGDSYSGSCQTGGTNSISGKGKSQPHVKHKRNTNLKPKDLVGIPWRVAFALQADGWYLRSDIIWAKSNPMPESVKDRPTKAHEYLFLLAKSQKYYYDAEAIKEPAIEGKDLGLLRGKTFVDGKYVSWHSPSILKRQKEGVNSRTAGTGRRNRRSVWTISTHPFPEAHFATFPPELVRPCILAGSPVGGTVLDPFGGSGTVSMVAMQEGRDSIYIDLNREYLDVALRRCGFGGSELTFDLYEVREV